MTKMAIINFSDKEEVKEQINKLLNQKLILFYILTSRGTVVELAAIDMGIPVLYIKTFDDLFKEANYWLIKDNGNIKPLLEKLKRYDRHGRVV